MILGACRKEASASSLAPSFPSCLLPWLPPSSGSLLLWLPPSLAVSFPGCLIPWLFVAFPILLLVRRMLPWAGLIPSIPVTVPWLGRRREWDNRRGYGKGKEVTVCLVESYGRGTEGLIEEWRGGSVKRRRTNRLTRMRKRRSLGKWRWSNRILGRRSGRVGIKN